MARAVEEWASMEALTSCFEGWLREGGAISLLGGKGGVRGVWRLVSLFGVCVFAWEGRI